MAQDAPQHRWLTGLIFGIAAVLLLSGLSSFGLWDPWEIAIADAARTASPLDTRPALAVEIAASSFEVLDVRAWTGRLPFALAGLLTCLVAFVLVRRHEGTRAARLTVLVLCTSPLLLINSRHMFGASIEMLAQALVALTAFAWVTRSAPSAASNFGYLAALIASTLFATHASGALQGVLPPLLAVTAAVIISRGLPTAGAWAVLLLAGYFTLQVTGAVVADGATLSPWLGGTPVGGDPPTFDAALERIFHGFAPWSALLLVAGGHLLLNGSADPERSSSRELRWMLLLWTLLSYVSLTLFSARYGDAAYLAAVPLAACVAIFLADASSDDRSHWPEAVVSALLVGLLIRDYAIYPDSVLRTIAPSDLQVPDVFHPRVAWAACFGLFALALLFALGGTGARAVPHFADVRRWLGAQWKLGWSFRIWLLLAGGLIFGAFLFGLACILVDMPLPTIATRWGRLGIALPFVIGAAVWGLPRVIHGHARLGRWRMVPLCVVGVATAAYLVYGHQTALSQHLSPRKVYDSYDTLAQKAEPLAVFRLDPKSAAYYTNAEIQEIKSLGAAVEYLGADTQQWLILDASKLTQLNRAYRQKHGRHLFVADARSATLVLASSQPVAGRENQNFIEEVVLAEEPQPQVVLHAKFGDKAELIGYDIDLPLGDAVGAGQSFEVTWYWRALARPPHNYKVFVHIDGAGQRVNGDHVPADGRYPTGDWAPGDIVKDTQTLRIPPNFPRSQYTFCVGLFSGGTRLEVTEGPELSENRVDAGKLRVK